MLRRVAVERLRMTVTELRALAELLESDADKAVEAENAGGARTMAHVQRCGARYTEVCSLGHRIEAQWKSINLIDERERAAEAS